MYSPLLLLALVGIAGINVSAAQDPTPQPTAAPAAVERPARIRLLGQNGIGLTMYTNSPCEDEYEEEIEGSGALSLSFKALVGKRRANESIGIAETETTRTMEDRNQLMANPYYTEFPLVPGQPVALQAQIAAGAGLSCGRGRGVHGMFVPEPGVDYEGEMVRDFKMMVCGISVRRVSSDGSLAPVQIEAWPRKCTAKARETTPMMVMLFDSDRMQYRLAESGAGIDELDNDEDGVEDFEEMMAEAPLEDGAALCIVGDDALDSSELGRKLPALLEARGIKDRALRFSSKALEVEWGLTEQHPLNFALAEYYCRSAAGIR